MKPQFQDLNIECWISPTRLGRRQPTICLFQSASDSCQPILDAVAEIRNEVGTAKRTLTFKPCARANACTRMRLVLLEADDELRQLCISVAAQAVTVEMTQAGLDLLDEAVKAWRDGAEDFGVAPDWKRRRRQELGTKDETSGEIWFWGPHYAGP